MPEEEYKLHITPKEILSNRYLQELYEQGIVTDEQIEAHVKEELIAKGIINEDFEFIKNNN